MSDIEHAGFGDAWLRSHPGTPIGHKDGEPCATCGTSETEATGGGAVSERVANALVLFILTVSLIAAMVAVTDAGRAVGWTLMAMCAAHFAVRFVLWLREPG